MRTLLLAAVLAPLSLAGCLNEVDEHDDDVDVDATTEGDGALGSATCGPVDRPARPAACPFGGSDMIVWASEGWNALGDVVAADLSACTDVYISVPPVTAEKTKLRPNEAANMRA